MNYSTYIKNYLLQNKKFFLFSIVWAIFCIIFLFLFPLSEHEKQLLVYWAKQYVSNFSPYINNSFLMFILIFINNSLIFFIILTSWFLLSLLWALLFLWQVVTIWVVVQLGITKLWIITTMLSIVPHWIFEISALILTLWLAFKITYLIVKKVWNFNKVVILNELKGIYKFFFMFIIPLTLFAAFIEAFITPLLT